MEGERYAEEANYWQTTVRPSKSQAEIVDMLQSFGAEKLVVSQGMAHDSLAWLIRFEWHGAVYRFAFRPLACKFPKKVSSLGGKRLTHAKRAEYQMGRIAVHFVKAILTAAEVEAGALFGFIELPAVARHDGGLPFTAHELNVSGVSGLLPRIGTLELPANAE